MHGGYTLQAERPIGVQSCTLELFQKLHITVAPQLAPSRLHGGFGVASDVKATSHAVPVRFDPPCGRLSIGRHEQRLHSHWLKGSSTHGSGSIARSAAHANADDITNCSTVPLSCTTKILCRVVCTVRTCGGCSPGSPRACISSLEDLGAWATSEAKRRRCQSSDRWEMSPRLVAGS